MRHRSAFVVVVALVVGCNGAKQGSGPALTASSPKLSAPLPIDPSVRGAEYLTAVSAQIQPAWGQFLEDCRLRLPATHPLNAMTLLAVADIAIARDGRIASAKITAPSGNGDFDTAAFDVLGDASPLPKPPADLRSDDDLVHLRWTFARDRRQAGPATAQVVNVELPLLGVVDKILREGSLFRAAQRVAASSDPDKPAAAERVMIAALREGLASGNGAVRRAAVDAIGRAGVHALAADVHRFVPPIAETELRLVAIAASAQLGDAAIAPALAADLRDDLVNRPKLAIARVQALVALSRGAEALAAIRAELAAAPPGSASPTALAALALVPDAELAKKLGGWFERGDAKTRAGVCGALPGAAPLSAPSLITFGLRDADALVRAACIEAAGRSATGGKSSGPADAAIIRRLRELARDRDRTVRARAIAVLGTLDPSHKERAPADAAPEVRAASAVGASEAELRALAKDREADVRAAALTALGERAPEVAIAAVADPSALVRRAAVPALDDERLAVLASDASPDVASAALVRLAVRRGRGTVTVPFLNRVALAGEGSHERVRLALAWLLAR